MYCSNPKHDEQPYVVVDDYNKVASVNIEFQNGSADMQFAGEFFAPAEQKMGKTKITKLMQKRIRKAFPGADCVLEEVHRHDPEDHIHAHCWIEGTPKQMFDAASRWFKILEDEPELDR